MYLKCFTALADIMEEENKKKQCLEGGRKTGKTTGGEKFIVRTKRYESVNNMYMLVKIATGTSANQRMISRRVVGSAPQI